MTMMRVMLAVSGSLCLLSLGLFTWLFYRKEITLLYMANRVRAPLSLLEKAFLALTIIGVFMCVFYGALAMLFWLPQREALAAFLALCIGGGLIGILADAYRHKVDLATALQHSEDLESVIACPAPITVGFLKEKLREFESRADSSAGAKHQERYLWSAESERIHNRQRIIKLLERQIGLLEQHAQAD